MPVEDRFGMVLSTESTAAAEEWQQGVDKLLSQKATGINSGHFLVGESSDGTRTILPS